jgi:hypothetical protein
MSNYQTGQTRQGDHEYGTIKVATVVPNSEITDSEGNEFKGNEDHLLGGRLAVVCTDINQNKPFWCNYAAPFGGAGYGFFSIPGPGAQVLITRVLPKHASAQFIWFSCLYSTAVEAGPDEQRILSNPNKQDSDHRKNESVDYLGVRGRGTEGKDLVHQGVPEFYLNYEDTAIPERHLWKTQSGHKIAMWEKHTKDVEEKNIIIETAAGKRIIMDDADPRTEVGTDPRVPLGMTGDRIIICDQRDWGDSDGGPNRIWIQSDAGEEGDPDSVNMFAKNHINLDTYYGSINLFAWTDDNDPLSEDRTAQPSINLMVKKGNINSVVMEDGHILEDSRKGHKLIAGDLNSKTEISANKGLHIGAGGFTTGLDTSKENPLPQRISHNQQIVLHNPGQLNASSTPKYDEGQIFIRSGEASISIRSSTHEAVVGGGQEIVINAPKIRFEAQDYLEFNSPTIAMKANDIYMDNGPDTVNAYGNIEIDEIDSVSFADYQRNLDEARNANVFDDEYAEEEDTGGGTDSGGTTGSPGD